MHYVKQFVELSKGDVSIAGGKGASLGEMTRAGIPVPPGFVLLASAFDAFLAETDMGVEIAAVLDTVNTAEMHTVEHAAEKIQALILNASMPLGIADEIISSHEQLGVEFVAVRSSATAEDSASAAWAGQLDSFLNTTNDTLLLNVQKCWASLFTPRAIFYRFEKKLHTQQVSVAVVVQTMVQSEISGIAFSVHPVTQDRNQLIIEAGYGLGEAIVSGQVTPDSYVITKSPLEIIDKNISTQDRMLVRSINGGNVWVSCSPPKIGGVRGGMDAANTQKLSDAQILELSQLIIKIENHYSFPCDIEWAWTNNQFYITQSRPITTLGSIQSNDAISAAGPQHTSSGSSVGNLDIHPGEYVKGFQSTGVSALIADIFTNYGEFDYLVFSKDDDYRIYIKQNLAVFRDLCEKYYGDFGELKDVTLTEQWFTDLETLKQKIIHEGCVVLSDLDTFVNLTYKILMEYSKFDTVITDMLFEQTSFSAKQSEGLIFYVNARKNTLKERINKVFFIEPSLFELLLSHICRQFTISRAELVKGTISDIRTLWSGSTDWANISLRGNYVILKNGTSKEYIFEPQASKLADKFLQQELVGGETVEGVSVSVKQKVIGKVAIISVDYNSFESLHKFQAEGEFVLVTGMTVPEMFGLMSQSAAVVTDIGGMLSHAAITSRELQIPCIVGTRNATVVLRDGDVVEVDANTGVVRILEKAK